jgi:hypothetical protein
MARLWAGSHPIHLAIHRGNRSPMVQVTGRLYGTIVPLHCAYARYPVPGRRSAAALDRPGSGTDGGICLHIH